MTGDHDAERPRSVGWSPPVLDHFAARPGPVQSHDRLHPRPGGSHRAAAEHFADHGPGPAGYPGPPEPGPRPGRRPGAGHAKASARKPPNIVFIFSDDHAYQAIGAYDDPRRLIETPNIDRLAREGMRFDRCLVPNSICGPSRATVLTGKYSHRNGFYNNSNSRFDGSQPDVPQDAPRRRVPDGDHRQVAPGHRPHRLRRVAHPARPGRLL